MAALHEQVISALISSLPESNLDNALPTGMVDTCTAMADLVDAMANLPVSPPSLYIDLEGVKLSRYGTLSIIQVHISPGGQTYLIDIYTLGEKAFWTSGSTGQTLKRILESDSIPKVFFDVRRDSDALFSHYGINLAGIHDIQLMELATRNFMRKHVKGLSKCIEKDISLTVAEEKLWKATKEKGLNLFAPERGGSYEVFNTRPLSEDIRLYCIQDVKFMPKLWQHYNSKITKNWAMKVEQATKDRVTLSQSAAFNGEGKHMALGPLGWN